MKLQVCSTSQRASLHRRKRGRIQLRLGRKNTSRLHCFGDASLRRLSAEAECLIKTRVAQLLDAATVHPGGQFGCGGVHRTQNCMCPP